MMHTDWLLGLGGGLIIGLAAAIFLLVNGRIMGASGILGGLVDGTGLNIWQERVAFIAGLVAIPALVTLLAGAPDSHITRQPLLLAVAGLLVGFGTRLANGCTSGHGVCGISRLSERGIVATVFYLLGGGITVFLFRHQWGII